jgi:hypothetical protein
MQRIRFSAAVDVFEAFPPARDDVRTPPGNEAPLDFLKRLQKTEPNEAVAFCAYVLPKREAVWWACQSIKGLGALAGRDAEAVALAEAWVRDPEDGERRAALDFAGACDASRAPTWLAFAAGWSGGSIGPVDGPHAAPGAHLTAKAIRAALSLGLAGVPGPDRAAATAKCIDSCIKFASGSDSRP